MISSSLPVILSLLGLWLILFLFFGILNVEVFGLTKWGNGESRNQNYSSLGSAIVMLAFMSAGYLFSSGLHRDLSWLILSARVGMATCTICKKMIVRVDWTLIWRYRSDLTYPRCTNSPGRESESDCGSTAWAFALFIAWNLLSMVRILYSSELVQT